MTLRAYAAGIALAASTAFSVCSAAAADLPVRPAPAPMAPVAYAPAAIYNWTGLYIGGQLGAGFGNSSWTDPLTGAKNNFNSGAGFLGGAQVGGNFQFNMLVVGVEGDFNWSSLKGSGTDFDRQHHQQQRELDLDRHRPGRRGFRSPPGLRQGRRRLRAGPERLHRSLRQQRRRHLHAHRLDRGRRAGIRHNEKYLGEGRIRLSRLRLADA